MFYFVLLFVFSRETWKMMAWNSFAQQTGKYRSIRHMEYPKFQTKIFGRMESAPGLVIKLKEADNLCWRSNTGIIIFAWQRSGTECIAVATSKLYTGWCICLGATSLANLKKIVQLLPEIFLILCYEPQTSHLLKSSVPHLHITRNLNITGRKEDITKTKTPYFFALKGLLNNVIF